MTEEKRIYPNPKFSSLKEEDEYWRTHSPLDEGYKGEIQKAKQNRSSFLSIRLTGEELTRLKEMATRAQMTPSVFVRRIINYFLENKTLNQPDPQRSAEVSNLSSIFFEDDPQHISNQQTWLQIKYNEIREKARDASSKARDGDPIALQEMLNAIFDILWTTLSIQQTKRQFQEFSQQIGAKSLISPLTAIETVILSYINNGVSSKEIAVILGTSEQTIRNYYTSILRKLNTGSQAETAAASVKTEE